FEGYNLEEVIITASIGVSFFPKDGGTQEKLIEAAFSAMTEAKRSGGDMVILNTGVITQNSIDLLMLETDLRYAREKDQLSLNFQPQIDALTGNICGTEVLLRWQHPI